jgi:hypothetical protein
MYRKYNEAIPLLSLVLSGSTGSILSLHLASPSTKLQSTLVYILLQFGFVAGIIGLGEIHTWVLLGVYGGSMIVALGILSPFVGVLGWWRNGVLPFLSGAGDLVSTTLLFLGFLYFKSEIA